MTTTADPAVRSTPTGHAHRRLSLSCLDDWPLMVNHANPRPDIGTRPPTDQVVVAAFCRYIERLGPFQLPDVRNVANAIDEAHFENDMSTVGTQRCVIVDGLPHAGKTYSAITHAFAETRQVWQADTTSTPSARSIPWVYVEIPPKAQALSLYQAVLTFCGMPLPSPAARANATILSAHVRDLAAQVGLRGIIFDDAHGIAGTDSRFVGDILKTVVTGVPATVVVVGAGLHDRRIFNTLPGTQVLERANWVTVGAWPLPPAKGDYHGPWGELAARFTKADPLANPERKVLLGNRPALTHLAAGSGQKPGTAIKWLKRAARYAVMNDTNLDLAALKAVEQGR